MPEPSATPLAPPQSPVPQRWSEAQRVTPAWDDAPLRVKLGLLLAAATLLGMLLGMLEARLGHRVWPMMLGLAALSVAGAWLTRVWVMTPFDRLMRRLDRLGRGNPGRVLRRLPTDRQDEVGRIARAARRVALRAVRYQHEANRLRRTLDHRVLQATDQATRQLKRLALRDPLTDLGNRRFLDENLASLVHLARAGNEDLLCVLIDIDHFKQVNDTRGHAAGDELLVILGSLLRATVRRTDLAARLGGDEFVVLFPSTRLDRAQEIAQQVRQLFCQQARHLHPTDPPADLSVGIASLRTDRCENGHALLAKADERLYAVKRDGRGR